MKRKVVMIMFSIVLASSTGIAAAPMVPVFAAEEVQGENETAGDPVETDETNHEDNAQTSLPAEENGVITLTGNVNLSSGAQIETDTILDLAGHNISLENATGDTITVKRGATLTIKGQGTISNKTATDGYAAIVNNGTVNITGTGVKIVKETGGKYYAILNHGTMTIEGGEITTKDQSSSLIDNGYYDYYSSSKNPRLAYVENTNQPTPSLTISGGTFSNGLNTVKNDDGGILTITGGEFINDQQVPVFNVNEVTITGGTFKTTGGTENSAVYTRSYDTNTDKGTTTITGGTFEAEYIAKSGSQNSTTTISGGDFTKVSKGIVNTTGDKNAKVSISGGTFAKDPSAESANGVKVSGSQATVQKTSDTPSTNTYAVGNDAITEAAKDTGNTITVTQGSASINVGNNDSATIKTAGGATATLNGKEVTEEGIKNSYVAPYIPPTTYSASIPTADNGKVTVSPASATAGTKVTVTVTPDEGYELDTLTATNGAGTEFQLTKNDDGTYSYNQPTSAVTIKATFKKTVVAPKFTDVPALGDLADTVNYGVSKGFINGTSETTFTPNGEVTRAQFAAFLYRLDGSKKVDTKASFDDISGDLGGADFLDAINWASANGIINGIGDNKFAPKDTVTREQAAAMLHRYEKSLTKTGTNTFTDVKSGAWYEDDINWGVANGIIQGYSDTTFGVGNNTTSGQAVQFIYRAEKQ